MSDDDAPLELDDSMDSDEDIFSAHGRRHSGAAVRRNKSLRTLRSHSGGNPHIPGNNLSVRRSTRNRMQTYDNLNTSWILGTQTLKGYPMFQQHGSSSDKDMADEAPDRPRDIRERMPLKSRENHPPSGRTSTRHMRDRSDMNGRELRDRSERNREMRDRSDQEKSLRELSERQEIKEKNVTRSKSNSVITNDERESRTRKNESPNRTREGPVTRLCGSLTEKDVKLKSEANGANEESSQESDRPENNVNSDNEDVCNDDKTAQGYEDMYTRVKRTRRKSQRQLQRRKKLSDRDSDMSESSDSPGPRKYSLRQKKPTIDRFQANVEPVRRSIRALRSVLTNSMRCRKHRSKSSSSSDSSESEQQRYDKKKGKKGRQSAIPQGGPTDRKADIDPITLDVNIRFSDVGGLESHIHCLKEMVVFPMMYPDVFHRFHITPPKGVLFHGPPGTGKTLIARALANECSQGSRKVAFFMRKGADCLSKWVGESERQLRLLFEQAQQMKPSIIFFDEIDGLAPVRSTKQDQIHASIVSTLLALMDGLSDRGEVIIIGATNRIDAIDPALRRPGRFDRELFFPLPAMKERLEILKIHVNKWKDPPGEPLLELLAENATGYCGSDLRALCTEAVLQGLRRTYPQIYMTSKRLLLDPQRVEVKKRDFMQASSVLVPSSHRAAPCISRKLQPFLVPLLGPAVDELIIAVKAIFPQGIKPSLAKVKAVKGIHRPRLLVSGDDAASGQGPRLAQALLYRMEHIPVQTLDVSTLFAESARSPEETCVQVFNEATRNIPSIIYIRSIDQWWPLVPETVKAVFLCRLASLDPCLPVLILATSDVKYQNLAPQLKNLFSELRGEIYLLKKPTDDQRSTFFKPIFMVQSLKAPQMKDATVQALEDLPLAPDPQPKQLTEDEKKILYEKEEISLRELRIFLREICAKLARNRQFFMFTKPVDTEEVPDYNMIIKQPMDLETMMTKIDMHSYLCARDFLDDIDLICCNALEYNPERDPADKLIRHRACSLRDNAYALIKAELDSDFEDKCREISNNRKFDANRDDDRCKNAKTESPNSPNDNKIEKKYSTSPGGGAGVVVNGRKFNTSRKRKIPAWARGYVKKVHKKKKISMDDTSTPTPTPTTTTTTTTETTAKNSPTLNEETAGIDLEKFQEFETEANNVLNGHANIFENTDDEQDSIVETTKDGKFGSVNVNNVDKRETTTTPTPPPTSTPTAETANSMEIVASVDDGKMLECPSGSGTSSRRESIDDLTFAIDSDDGPAQSGDNEKVIVDRGELESAWQRTVDITKLFSVELLCDIYVQLSRCVGKYAHTYDRKTLPKDLLKELKRFEMYKATINAEPPETALHSCESTDDVSMS